MKITVSLGRNDTFDSKRSKFIRGIFLVGEMNNFLAVGWDSSPSPGFPIIFYKNNRVYFWEITLLNTILY